MLNFQTFYPQGNIRGPIMPEQILQSKTLSPGAKLLYASMIKFTGEKDHCWPSYSVLAESIGCSVSSIKNYLKELEKEKLIFIKKNIFKANQYFFLRPEWAACKSSASGPAPSETKFVSGKSVFLSPSETNSGYGESKFGYEFNLKNLNNIKPPLPPQQANSLPNKPESRNIGGGGFLFANSLFEKFWESYPRKEAKELARSVWHRLYRQGKIPALECLLPVLEKFKSCAQWLKEHGRYIPQCVNWLKGCRWLDENLDAGASLTPNEKAISEESRKRTEYFLAQEEKRKNEENQEAEKNRPEFEALVSKFPNCEKTGPAWGLWNLLLKSGKAPKAKDVPDNISIGIYEFLKYWQRNCPVPQI